MAKKWQDVLDEARTINHDREEPYRFSNDQLIAILNRGLIEVARVRPEFFPYDETSGDIIAPEVVAAELDSDVTLPVGYFSALVFYVSSMIDITDDEFSTEGRAMSVLGLFKAQLVAP